MRGLAIDQRGSARLRGTRTWVATGRVHLRVTPAVTVLATALAGACAAPDQTSTVWQEATVESHVPTGCSTSVVIELSRQIAEEVDCLMPGQLVRVSEGDGIVFTGAAVLPYLSEAGRADLLAAAAEGGTIELNSAYRSVAQQYLLRRWYEQGRCGITAAAQPGESNHESGRAIDVNNWSERRAALEANGWAQTVPGDEVHFDHLASPDLRGSDVLAFQRLWNRNHPGVPIDEDGFWGPMTQMALAASPAEGFPIGATCDGGDGDPDPDGPQGPGDGVDPGGDGRDPASLTGGCDAGGGGSLALIALVLVSAAVARRR